MRRSVRGGNTISIVQSLVVNGTAREISPLSPEEHLRTEHQRVFQVSARPQCLQTPSATETVLSAEQRAEVMKQNRDEEAGRKTHLLNAFSIFPTLLLFFPLLFHFTLWHPNPSLHLSFCLYHLSPSSPSSLFPLLFLPLPLSAYTPRFLLDFQREAGIAAAGIQTS